MVKARGNLDKLVEAAMHQARDHRSFRHDLHG